LAYIVTGGFGYIGRHLLDFLQGSNSPIVVIDKIGASNVTERFPNVTHIDSDLNSPSLFSHIESLNMGFEGIFHLAALKSVPESFENPRLYQEVNYEGTSSMLQVAKLFSIPKFVFTSSAAIYKGRGDGAPISETDLAAPISPYGVTKLSAEHLVTNAAKEWGLKSTSLRLFNVAGATSSLNREKNPNNVIPLLVNAVRNEIPFKIFGADHSTCDGTTVRDYIHVSDVVEAQCQAMALLESSVDFPHVFNIGSGEGKSLLELVRTLEELTSRKVTIEFEDKREGDVASMVANITQAKSNLAWSPKCSFQDILMSLL
jgi:UDP-glucose 4-epimerase